jgi:superoxide dismutase, Cu-Zn family
VIHEEKDDGMTQPEGDSGARIACGEISKDNKK